MKHKLAVFASGSGSNAVKVIEYFKDHPTISVELVACNKANAGIVSKSELLNVHCEIFSKKELYDSNIFLELLSKYQINFIVLAGFLLKIPDYLIQEFNNCIVNIHPSLLPKYGGKGMYGMNVHNAVVENKENESGISIHLVNEHFDEGKLIAQEKVALETNDTPEMVQKKVQVLEHKFFAPVIEEYLKTL